MGEIKNRRLGYGLIVCLLLQGCGFQLKGTSASGASQTLTDVAITLVSSQPRGELTAAVASQLRLEGALLDTESDDALLLRLGDERFEQRNLSLTAQARSAEVELTMTVALTLRRGPSDLIPATDAQVIRQFLNDPRNVVGKTEELRLLREEMRRDLAAQITRRITHSLNN